MSTEVSFPCPRCQSTNWKEEHRSSTYKACFSCGYSPMTEALTYANETDAAEWLSEASRAIVEASEAIDAIPEGSSLKLTAQRNRATRKLELANKKMEIAQ